MITLFSLFLVLTAQVNTIDSDSPFVDICSYDKIQNQVICNGYHGNRSDDSRLPSFDNLPPVTNYVFSNFKEIQANAFENVTFLPNCSITINLINIATIHSEAFSASMTIPPSSTLSINIENPNNTMGLTLETHAFNYISIDHLHFFNINSFNGGSIFDAHSFGADLFVNTLIFEQSNLTGFSSVTALRQPNIEHVSIWNCPSLTTLTKENVPAFLTTAKTFEISGTGLQSIDNEIFESWEYVFEGLVIKNNINLHILPELFVESPQLLKTLDLSNNSITTLDSNYDWSLYYTLKHLILKQQSKLDLFLKSDILKNVGRIRIIDFSQGIINENDQHLIRDHVSNMPNLASINISYTNFTDNMVIDFLTIISNSANQTIQVSLLNHTLNDTNFCSYFQIFQQAPNLFHLELDETHECNCIVDLFYDDEHIQMALIDTLIEPACLANLTRARCDIQQQLSLSQCSVGKQNPDDSNNGDMGTLAFIGTMVGLAIVLIALLALGSSVIYRARRRGMTILDMDVEDAATTTVEQPLARSISETISEPLQNSF